MHLLSDASQLFGYNYLYIAASGYIYHLKQGNPNNNIIACGHSLGGGLAQFSIAANYCDSSYAYGYNSAGISPKQIELLNNLNEIHDYNNIIHFCAYNDLIHRMCMLLGDIKYILSPKYHVIHILKNHNRSFFQAFLSQTTVV